MGDLQIQSTIVINTQNGERQIQLLFGDITKLPQDQKVDVIMVSAFPGDYAATPTSVIGALKKEFNLKVAELARHRAEDLRRNFYCWWSQPLQPSLPYRRLLCFERPPREISHPARLVGDVFRALVPAFDNQESTVITPVLASGDQNYSQPIMLKAMVDAAAHWILIGLPLVCLKIVIYSRDLTKVSKEQKTILDQFQTLKRHWESRPSILKEPEVKYDVYLSYSTSDIQRARDVENKLRHEKSDIRIFSDKQSLDVEKVWQEEIYQVMVSCIRVITFLSPSYLESTECIEQYNIALCCDRRLERDILAPFYLYTIPVMPSYMALMQYLDLRVENESEKFEVKLSVICRKFIEEVLPGGLPGGLPGSLPALSADKSQSQRYDVFISYCHKNSDQANYLMGLLLKYNPEINIFFDRNELKTGGLWQKTLYTSLDNSRCCLCLLSRDYLNSAICTEEYNLALLRHLTQRSSLVPVVIEDIHDVIQPWCQKVRAVDARVDFNDVINFVARSVNTFIRFQTMNNVFDQVTEPIHVSTILENWRKSYCTSRFQLDTKSRQLQLKNPPELSESESESGRGEEYDIVFSYHSQDSAYVQYLSKQIEKIRPDLKLNLGLASEHEHVKSLDQARLIISCLSSQYLLDRKCSDEFHIALNRHRAVKTRTILYPILVERLLAEPTFAYMFPSCIDVRDQCWSLLAEQSNLGSERGSHPYDSRYGHVMSVNYLLALQAAVLDVVTILTTKQTSSNQDNVIIANIVKLKTGGVMEKVTMDLFLKKLEMPKLTINDDVLQDRADEMKTKLKLKPKLENEAQKEARSSSATLLRSPPTVDSKHEVDDVTGPSGDVTSPSCDVTSSSCDVTSSSGDVTSVGECKEKVRTTRSENLGKDTSAACLIV